MSWKEISVYLAIDERTCARWEKRFGMPIHRAADGSVKSRVFAYSDELDRWLETAFPSRQTPNLPHKGRSRLRMFGRVIAMAAIILGAMGALLGLTFLWNKGATHVPNPAGQPYDFHIRGSNLIIVNEDGQQLWRRDLGVDGLCSEEKYRRFFQVSMRERETENLPWLVIKDINADGKSEVLIAIKKANNTYGEGVLFCFNSMGKELWRFKAGREMSYGGRAYSRDYRIHGFIVHDIDSDGHLEIFVSSFHYPWELCQVAALDSRGALIGEFWNSGYIADLVFSDLDDDGREELYAAGVNNEYAGGCLIVFNPANIGGASPQSDSFRFDEVGEGTEIYYIDFPRSVTSQATGDLVAGNLRITPLANKRIQVEAHLGLFYEFDSGLSCVAVRPGHEFLIKSRNLVSEEKLLVDPENDAYIESLRLGLRYWTGTRWTNTPSRNLSPINRQP